MARFEIFDPPMCCSSGVCGPSVDNRLVAFRADLEWLKACGATVQRYNPAQQYEAFAANPTVVAAVNERGTECLPLILVDGELVSMGGYPDRDELAAMAGVDTAKEVGR